VTHRRCTLAWLAASLLIGPLPALAQRNVKPARLGWLSYLSDPDPGLDLLREGLRDLGYVEGKSFVIVARFANGDFTRLPMLVEELGAERIDVLVSRGPSVDFTKTIRSRIPVVFAFSGDPVAAGFGDSLRQPGRNMTGITFMAMELSTKRVELLMELVPHAKRIALLSNPEHSGELSEYRVTEEAAHRLDVATTRYLVRAPQELAAAFAAIRARQPDAMIVFPDSLTLARRKDIAEFAAKARIPSMYGWTEFADAGGLASYGPTLSENFKALAVFVDKILKGADASNIPIEQVRKIGLTFNLGAAKALGLAVPPSILQRAEKVIE
jgi:putative tryptophan/tyrosine transport system substrate-binding protein